MINFKKEVYSTKKEWLTARGIGGSSVSAIIGKSKWLTANDVYNQLVFKRNKKIADNDRMEEGREAEHLIRELFCLEHPEYRIVSPPLNEFWLFRRLDQPLFTLTPDALINENSGFIEIKDIEIRKKSDLDNWIAGIIPRQYLFQLLWYFVVMNTIKYGILLIHFKIYDFNDINKTFELNHDETYFLKITREKFRKEIKNLEKKANNFVKNNIEKKIRPDLTLSFKHKK